jgi:hypothetical protein
MYEEYSFSPCPTRGEFSWEKVAEGRMRGKEVACSHAKNIAISYVIAAVLKFLLLPGAIILALRR